MLKQLKTLNQNQVKNIKIGLFILCLLPILRLVWQGFNDNLSANPIEFIERNTGYWALLILLITLSLTPLRLTTKIIWPVQLRRMLGLFMFFYAVLHLITYLFLDYNFEWSDILKDIIKHPYVLVGFSAFILTIPLAATSNNAMIKKLGTRWKTLHKSVYLIAILGVIHFWWLVKKDLREPILFAIILTLLLLVRIYFKYKVDSVKK